MNDAPVAGGPAPLRSSAAGQRDRGIVPAPLVPGARVLFAGEAALPMVILVAILVVTHLDEMPAGLDSFLSIRVTVKNVLLCVWFLAAWITILRLSRIYDRRAVHRLQTEMRRLVVACTLGTSLALAFPLTSISGAIQFRHLVYLWIIWTALALAVRGVRRALLKRGRARAIRRVIIVGTGPRAGLVLAQLAENDAAAYELVGFVDAPRHVGAIEEFGRRRLGSVDDLERLLMGQAVDDVYITLPIKSCYPEIQQTIEVCERVGVRTKYQADMFATSVAWPRVERGGTPVVTMHVVPDDDRLALKRLLDVVGAACGLILLSPILLIAAVAVRLTSRGPVLFAQERYGLNKRSFRMLKFRTMVADAEQLQETLEDRNEADGPVFKITRDPRVTSIGRFLRKTSIDELPQLVNVLAGDMSLVGPRPLPVRDVRRFTRASDMRRFSVKPGLTCLWQISGRNQLGFNDWVRLDLKYIDGWSLVGDLRILARTIPAVLRGTGAN